MRLNYSTVIKLLIISLSAGIISSCGIDDGPIPVPFAGEIEYVKTFGGSDEDDAISLVQANDGGYVILGTTKSTDGDLSDKTTDDRDIWLLKLDAAGEKIWSNTYGGTGTLPAPTPMAGLPLE